MLTLLLGTDWVSNRAQILNRITQDVTGDRNGRILIVPELISHDTERRLCDAAGDTVSRFAEVLSFTQLAERVSDAVGGSKRECLDNGGRVVAMASAARQLHSRLKAYAAVETRPEFLVGLVETVDELKRCCISAEQLMQVSSKTEGSFAQKLEEIGLLYETYDSLCSHGNRDPRDKMTWLLEELEDSSFAQDHVFYIDGFPDFTRQHMAILEHLIHNAQNVTVSLTCDKPGTSALAYEKAGDTAAQLIRCANAGGIEVVIENIPPRKDALAPIRDRLFQGNIDACSKGCGLQLYRTETIYQECLAAAEKILSLIHAGARYRDIGVVCADPSAYRHVLQMAFERCHIPAYLSGTDEILGKSVVTSVLTALNTAFNGFEQKDVLDYIKSILSPLDLATCDRVENYVILWGIKGNLWLKDWDKHPDGLGATITDASERTLRDLNDARNLALAPLVKLRDGFYNAGNLGQQVMALYAFFTDIGLRKKLDDLARELDRRGDKRNAQILNQLWDILITALEQMYDVLGDTQWDSNAFARLFKLLLSQYDVGTIPSVLDSVTVGPVSAMRCHQVKHLLVLGASEGCLPSYCGSTGVFTDQERSALRQLGVPLTGGGMQGLQTEFAEIYGVFCSAEETVTVSCPGGQPSFIYRRLVDLAGGETDACWELGPALADATEACAYISRYDATDAAAKLDLSALYNSVVKRKLYEQGNVRTENIFGLYGDTLRLSASQVDKQAECRLSYFLKYGLRVRERKAATVDPAEFGTYVHAVLEKTVKHIMEELGGFTNVSMDEAVEIAMAYSREYVTDRFGKLDSQRISYLSNRNSQELELVVCELWKELQGIGFKPVDFELDFGITNDKSSISIPSHSMTAQLRGFVDRVDLWDDGARRFFRVVDYKTGKKDFDYCDIFNGLGLQMLLYLFALESDQRELYGKNAVGAGVQYFPARVPFVSADGRLADHEAEAAREKLWKRKGLLLADDAVLDAMESDEAPKRLPYSRRKDGSLVGDLADCGQFALLKNYVFKTLGKMVDEIASGCVAPNPYTRGSAHNACTFCPYGAICHQETVEGRRNYKTMTAERFWDEVRKEVTDHD